MHSLHCISRFCTCTEPDLVGCGNRSDSAGLPRLRRPASGPMRRNADVCNLSLHPTDQPKVLTSSSSTQIYPQGSSYSTARSTDSFRQAASLDKGPSDNPHLRKGKLLGECWDVKGFVVKMPHLVPGRWEWLNIWSHRHPPPGKCWPKSLGKMPPIPLAPL